MTDLLYHEICGHMAIGFDDLYAVRVTQLVSNNETRNTHHDQIKSTKNKQ